MLLGLLGAAEATAKPRLGQWEGTGADGTRIELRVMKARGDDQRAVTYVILSCLGYEQQPVVNFWAESEGSGGVGPGDTGKPDVFPIRRGGRVRAPGFGSPSLSGRLGKQAGKVRIDAFSCGDEIDQRIRVRRVGGASDAPTSGVWRALGAIPTDFRFEVFGSAVNYFAGQVLTGIGVAQGAPVPCVIPLGFLDAASVLPAWIGTDGAFTIDEPEPPLRIDGQFDGESSLSGSYSIDPGFLNRFYLKCKKIGFPFTAELERAAPPPRLHGVRLVDRGGRGGGDDGDDGSHGVELPAPSEPTDYVALGDSYSAGEGVPPFEPGTDRRGNRCHRSKRAFSRVFDPRGYTFHRAFFACSGATTANLGRLEGGALTGVPQKGEPAIQLERLDPAGWRPTDLITVTIGGNDARFGGVLFKCIFRLRCHRGRSAKRITERIATEVPPALASAYAAIRSRVPLQASGANATVVVLGYPQLFPRHARGRCGTQGHVVPRKVQAFLRERGRQLNRVIRSTAEAAGFHYVSVARTFKGHEVCGKHRQWLHGLRLSKHRYSYHPNARGQRAYARRLLRYFGCLHRRGFPFSPAGVPANPGADRVIPPACAEGR